MAVSDSDPRGADDLPAGDFSAWLTQIQEALRGERDSDVPCDGCTACCRSYQFIHIGPDETDTLANVPKPLLFPAPGLPRGHMVLGYDEHGRCPMLIDDQCSIYEHRPRTCRTYDCRVFPASGVEVDDDRKVLIAERVRRWRFTHPSEADRRQHEAVRAAAEFLRRHPDVLPAGASTSSTQLAVAAVEVHGLFDRGDNVAEPEQAAVRSELRRWSRGDRHVRG